MAAFWEQQTDRRTVLRGLGSAGVGLGMAAWASPALAGAATKPKRGGTLQVGHDTELVTMDPCFSSAFIEREVYYNLYESLLQIDPALNIVPGLATSWKATDPQTYVLSLRKGVKFQDGTTFDATAAKWNLDRYVQTSGSYRASELASVSSVDVQDANTIVIHLKAPDSTLLSQLVDRAGMMLSPTAVQKLGSGFQRNATGVGSGPFQFKEWVLNDHLTITRNDHYHDSGLPYLDTITYHPITDLNALLNQFRSGSLDLVRTLNGKDVATVKTDSNLFYRAIPGLGFDSFQFNCAGLFSDVKKRQAVALAVDRSALVRTIYFDVGPVGYGPIPPRSWAFAPGEKTYAASDKKKAKQLGGGLEFTLKTSSGTTAQAEAQLLQAELEQAGITMHIQLEQSSEVNADEVAHQFDAALVSWSGRLDPDGNTYGWFDTQGPFNWGQYHNAEVNSLLEQGRQQSARSKRKPIYDKLQSIVVTEAPLLFYHFWPAQEIHSAQVKGFTLYPDGMNRLGKVWKS